MIPDSELLNAAAQVPPLLILTVALLITLRMPLRHLARNVRERFIGPLVWHQLIPQGRYTNARTLEQQVTAVHALVGNLGVSMWPPFYRTRPVMSFVWSRGRDGQLRLYLGVSQRKLGRNATVVDSLANGLNARAKLCSGPPGIPKGELAVAYRSLMTPAMTSLYPSGLGPVAQGLADNGNLRGALIVTLDMMRKSEGKRHTANVTEEQIMRGGESAKYGSGIVNQAGTMVATGCRSSIAAVAEDGTPESAQEILDQCLGKVTTLGLQCSRVHLARHHCRLLVVTNAAAALLAFGYAFLGISSTPVTIASFVIPVVAGALALMRAPLLARDWLGDRAERGEVVVPPFYWWSLRWRVHSLFRSLRTDAGSSERVDNKIAPPSCKQVIPLYGAPLAELITDTGRDTGTVERDAIPMLGIPEAKLRLDGPGILLGLTGEPSQRFRYPVSELNYGMAVFGGPGTGKTNLLATLFTALCDAMMRDAVGDYRISPIWGEVKGDGAYRLRDTAARHNPDHLFIDAHNPRAGVRLALEGPRLSDGANPDEVVTNAAVLTSAMQFAYGEGIRESSREALDHAFRISLLLSPDELKSLGLDSVVDPQRPNVVTLAHLLLSGGDGELQLGRALLELGRDGEEPELNPRERDRVRLLGESVNTLRPYLEGNNRGARDRAAAPLNKLTQLRDARALWEPNGRPEVVIRDAVMNFAPTVVNMGSYLVNEDTYSQDISPALAQRTLLMFNFLVWDYIKANCAGWSERNFRVPLFCDEVGAVAVDSDNSDVTNVFYEVNQRGRSYGAAFFVGAQNPAQLPRQAAHEALALRSKVWFALQNWNDALVAERDLSGGDEDQAVYSAYNVSRLPVGAAVARINVGRDITPPFTLLPPQAEELGHYLSLSGSVEEAVGKYAAAGNKFGRLVGWGQLNGSRPRAYSGAR